MTRTSLTLIAAAIGLWTTGCAPAPAPTPVTTPPPATVEAATDDHGHEHDAHNHPTEGPHHGVLVELGNEEYHAEVTHDDATGTVSVYLLDGSAEKFATTAATEVTINVKHGDTPAQFTLVAKPQETDPAGQTSHFTVTDKELIDHMEEAGASAKLSITVGGTPYSGAVPAADHSGHDHGHDHSGADALVWPKTITAHGYTIQLGHHGVELHAGTECEPAVSITRDGQPVADAKVFNVLQSADGQQVLAAEVATTYEPTTADEPAHYAQGGLAIPKDVQQVTLQFRIVLPDVTEEVVESISVPIH